MNKKIPIYLSAIIVVIIISGCASTLSRAFTPPGHVDFYPGIEANYDALTDKKEDVSVRIIMGIVDVPFSLIQDTLFIPFDTYDYFKFKHEDKRADQCEEKIIQKITPSSHSEEPVTYTSIDEIFKQTFQEP